MPDHIDPVFHVTSFHQGNGSERYHLRYEPALEDFQARVAKGAELVELDKWTADEYETLQSYTKA